MLILLPLALLSRPGKPTRTENKDKIHRGSYMGAHVLLNLLNELGERDKCEPSQAFYLFSATSLINSIIQKQNVHMTLKIL